MRNVSTASSQWWEVRKPDRDFCFRELLRKEKNERHRLAPHCCSVITVRIIFLSSGAVGTTQCSSTDQRLGLVTSVSTTPVAQPAQTSLTNTITLPVSPTTGTTFSLATTQTLQTVQLDLFNCMQLCYMLQTCRAIQWQDPCEGTGSPGQCIYTTTTNSQIFVNLDTTTCTTNSGHSVYVKYCKQRRLLSFW